MSTLRIPPPELLPAEVRQQATTVVQAVERYEAAAAARNAADLDVIAAERDRPGIVRAAAAEGQPIPTDELPALRHAATEARTVETTLRQAVDAERNRLRQALAALPPEAVTVADERVSAASDSYRDALATVERARDALHEAFRLRGWLGQAVVPHQVRGAWRTSLGAWQPHRPAPSLEALVAYTSRNGQRSELALRDALDALAADADRLDALRADEGRRIERARRDAAAEAANRAAFAS
jgi:hypothetical protein